MSGFDINNLQGEFVAESKEHLSSIEPALLLLEKDGASVDSEAIHEIFRAIHSIKGASGFFGFEKLKQLSHVMESVLMEIREGRLVPEPAVVDVLLNGVDKLTVMIEDLQHSEDVLCDELLGQLDQVLAGEQISPPSPSQNISKVQEPQPEAPVIDPLFPNPLEFKPERQAVITELAKGDFLYAVWLAAEPEAQSKQAAQSSLDRLKGIGVVLDRLNDGAQGFVYLFTSEKTEVQISEVIGIQASRIKALDFMQVLEGISSSSLESDTGKRNRPSGAMQQKGSGDHDASDTVRVKVMLLNKLMNLAGEMVLMRNQLTRTLEGKMQDVENLPSIMQNLNLLTSDIQEHIMQTRMQPIGSIFSRFPRVVRDMARILDKNITLYTSGEDVELDRSLIESLSDPLTHLIRNGCDHGIEMPEKRKEKGKDTTGTLELQAFHEGGQINIVIRDDGAGIDVDKLAKRAIKMGVVGQSDLQNMSRQEQLQLIFTPGLSTVDKVSELSGRGVGMDVVRNNIEKMGGQITVESDVGQGTIFRLRLPLTLAIIPSLIVRVQGERFAIAQASLVELLCVQGDEITQRIEKIGQAEVLRLRGKLLPLVHLSQILEIERFYIDSDGHKKPDRRYAIADDRLPFPNTAGLSESSEDVARRLEQLAQVAENIQERRGLVGRTEYYIAVVRLGGNEYGVIVDEILDLEEIVVKPLSTYLKNCRCFSGATIMGDGQVAMILDVGGLALQGKLNFKITQEEELKRQSVQQEQDDDRIHMDIILFNNAQEESFAVPLNEVLRLEKICTDDIDRVGEQEFISYRDKGLPIVRIENVLPVRPFPKEQTEGYLIIPREGGGDMGILASEILDTFQVSVKFQPIFGDRHKSVMGAAIVNERLVPFLKPYQLKEENKNTSITSSQ